jgi:histidinol-phosphatase (PHP family)
MFPIDYHVHTGYTADAEGTVEEYCVVAERLGIKEIAFTNHLIYPKPKSVPGFTDLTGISIQPSQIEKHVEEIETARKKFRINIKFGLEVDYFENHEKQIEELLDSYPLDFVMGSAHFVDGFCVSDKISAELFLKGNLVEKYKKYFDVLKKAVESQLFDVMAHADVIRKFSPEQVPFEKYAGDVEKVSELLYDNGVGIEINASGFRLINDTFPSMEFLGVCKKNNVKIITVGSDAHSPHALGFRTDELVERLKTIGYKNIYTFSKRKPKEFPI